MTGEFPAANISIGPKTLDDPMYLRILSLAKKPLGAMLMAREPVAVPLPPDPPCREFIVTVTAVLLGLTITSEDWKSVLEEDGKSR